MLYSHEIRLKSASLLSWQAPAHGSHPAPAQADRGRRRGVRHAPRPACLALSYLSRPRALGAANTSKLSCGAGRALGDCDKPKGSSVSAEARTFRCETHRALADARRARARAGERVFGGVVKRHVGREPESGRGRTTSLLLGAFKAFFWSGADGTEFDITEINDTLSQKRTTDSGFTLDLR